MMKVLREDNITSCDVDGTLVIWPRDYHVPKEGRIKFQYGDEIVYLYPHVPHITFLKYCSKRGDFIEVWSKNKHAWAEEVITVLGLKDYVDLCRSKPDRHIDDKKDLEEVVGGRIFMPYDPEEK